MGFDKESGQIIECKDNIMKVLIPSTGNVYKIQEPVGNLAPDHFILMSKGVPMDMQFEDERVPKYEYPRDENGDIIEGAERIPVFKTNEDGTFKIDEDGDPIPVMTKVRTPRWSDANWRNLFEAFKAWCENILNKPGAVVVEGLPFDKMPPADMFGIFMALYNRCNSGVTPFRLLVGDGV